MKSKIGWWALLAGMVLSIPALAEDIATSSLKTAPAGRPFAYTGDWKFDLGGGNAQEGKDTWSAGYLYFHSHLDFKLIDSMSVHLEPMARLYGGRAQERYDDDSLDSRVGVSDAHLSFSPVKFAEIKAGVLSQRFLDQQMLVSGLRVFPGVQGILKAETGELKGRLVLQQVIPNSYSLNTEREKQETLPWFRTQHAEAEGKHFGWLEWNPDKMSGVFLAYPQRDQIPERINEQLIVELYSK